MIVDNRQNGRVGDIFRENISPKAKLSVLTNRLSLFTFQKLKKEL